MSKGKQINIVGWGIAGVTLGWQLYFQKRQFEVIDANNNQSSRTAAGLINPITFKRQNKSWMADDLLPEAERFYAKVEGELGQQLITRKNIFRVFSSVEEENNWASKQGDERYEKYLKTPSKEALPSQDLIKAPFGMGEVDTIGYLDTNTFIDASKRFFEAKGVKFHSYEYDAKYICEQEETLFFFCEGYGVKKNALFDYLPLNGTHGETLIIKTNQYDFDGVLNRNMYLLPIGNQQFKVGATYNWELKKPVITEEAKQDLIERLKGVAQFDYMIVDQKAGVRPTVTDRKPLIGIHPEQKNAIVFNGLGTKGVMLAPYFSAHLLAHIFENASLNREVDIERFQKFFSNKLQD